MDNNANIVIHPHRPEIFVLGPIKLVKAHARISWIQLQIKGGDLHGLLLFAGEFGEAVGKGVGDEKVHRIVQLLLFWDCWLLWFSAQTYVVQPPPFHQGKLTICQRFF